MRELSTQHRRAPSIPAWGPYLVLALSVLFTAAVTYWSAAAADSKDQARFEVAAQRLRGAIQTRLDTYIALLLSGRALFAGSDDVTLGEFRSFVAHLELHERYPGIQGIGFSAWIPPDQRDEFVANMRAQGMTGFTIRPDHPRDEITAIAFLEPLDRRNQAALGYDMFAEPVRRAAMERARDTGAPAATGRVTLVQEIDEQKQAGFLIYVPLYRRDALLTTPEQRRAALRGFVYSPFRADDLLHGILSSAGVPTLGVQVYDGPEMAPEHLLHSSAGPGGGGEQRSWRRSVATLDIAGRSWTVAVTGPAEFDALSARAAVPYVFVGGALVSLLLFGVTRAQARAQRAAEQVAVELGHSERSLRQSEQRLRDVLDGITTFVGVMRPDGTLVEANRAMLGAAAITPEAALGKPFEDATLWPSEGDRKAVRAAIERARAGEVARLEARMQAADDRSLTVALTIAPLRGPDGGVDHLISTGTDITDRVKAEQERARLHEEMIRMQADRLAELSTPLIPLSDRIVLMPLVGTMDAQRARQVLEIIAVGVADRQACAAIIDITGVPTIDTQVASALLQAAQVVRLLGAEVVLTGLRPAVAQTLVQLGIDLGGVVTRNDLQSGIRHAMHHHERRA